MIPYSITHMLNNGRKKGPGYIIVVERTGEEIQYEERRLFIPINSTGGVVEQRFFIPFSDDTTK